MSVLRDTDRSLLEGLGFEKLTAPDPNDDLRRLILIVEALEKTGKSDFALRTAPEPVGYINFDIGLEGLEKKFAHRDIMVKRFLPMTALESKDEAVEVWKEFLTVYGALLGRVKTIVIDTASELWEIMRLAEFGKLTQVKSHHYAPVNLAYKRLIRRAYEVAGQNLIMIHRLRPLYVGEQRTSDLERSGYGEAGYDSQGVVRLWHRPEENNPFGLTIMNSRTQPQLAGREFSGAMRSFDVLLDLLVGE